MDKRVVGRIVVIAMAMLGGGCGAGVSGVGDGGDSATARDSNDHASNPWRQFRAASGPAAYCRAGSTVGVACSLTPTFPCRGNPEIRVCETNMNTTMEDCAQGRLRIIAEFRNEESGHCPRGEFICPPTGQYVMMIRSIQPGETFVCPNEA
ncbi:MAG: hypothetical protein Q8Q09_10345 [Deltaproteobacteria bacterium]|nr:hypothetical protein [Deltaproteobacteria bacterium]